MAAGGGFLVGLGATMATGCVVGNILSGWALMSIGGVVFGLVTILANWGTTELYLRGLRRRDFWSHVGGTWPQIRPAVFK